MGKRKTQKKKLTRKEKKMKQAHNKLVKFLKIAFHNDKVKAQKEMKNKKKVEKEMEKKVDEKIKKEQVSEQEIEHLERYFSDSSLESDDEPDPPSAAAAISV